MKAFKALAAIFLLTSTLLGQRVITTIAGADWLFPGDGRKATDAPLSGTSGMDIAMDAKGNLFIADAVNFMVMKVGADGILNVVAGNGVRFQAGDGGPAVNAALFLPTSIAVDAQGNVYGGVVRRKMLERHTKK